MKTKKWLVVILLIILSVCTLFGGCKLFEGSSNNPDNSGDTTIEQPDKEPDKDEDKDNQQTETHTHSLAYVNKVKATCTTDGTVARWECSVCGKNFSDKNGKKEITSIEIKASGHTLTHHTKVKATCTTDGNIEYWSCSFCEKNFSDKDGNTAITDIKIKATGHTYSTSWTSGETHHWHEATCKHTDEVKDKEVHSFNNGVCVCGKEDMEYNRTYGKFTVNDFLKTDGTYVKTKGGETVYLRGTNAGGLFVTEHWMTGFEKGKTSSDDYKSITLKFIERFGVEQTQQLWAEYRANWWTDTDFKNCADMGMTVIRLPFTYMNVDFAAISDYDNAGKNYDFTALDEFVNKAAEYGLYTILDLHGAYGSQNGQDHSGEIIENKTDVDFYSNEKMQELTVNLWSALAKHYKNNPAVAGYDILNEPGEKGGSTSASHWNFYDKIYKAIRAENDNHIVMFESCWEWYNLPKTTQYDWTNCMYSFHHYVGDSLTVDDHVNNWTNKLSGISKQNFGLPLQMGEFTAYDSTEKWEKTLELLNDNNWHYTSWTYKVWGTMAWGIVNISGNKVDPSTDSYSDIVTKFRNMRTENAKKYTFKDSNRTLYNIMRQYLTGEECREPEITATYVGFENDCIVVKAMAVGVNSIKFIIQNTASSSLFLYEVGEVTLGDSGNFELRISLAEFNSAKSNANLNLRAFINGDTTATNVTRGDNCDISQTYTYNGRTYRFAMNGTCVSFKY